jgi:hypothetical protein
MRPSLRFLAIAIVGWAGVRAATLGAIPGADLFNIGPARPTIPPVVPTQFPPIEPVAVAPPQQDAYPQYAPPQYAPAAYPYQQPMVRPVMVPVYYAAPASAPAVRTSHTADAPPPLRPLFSGAGTDEWPLPRLAAISTPARSSVVVVQESMPAPPVPPIDQRLDRLQLASWALLRSQQTGVAGSRSLATGGQLGASQAGARLIYNFNRQLALAARMSSEVGRRGGEVAAGVRVRPLVDIPVWLTAERRQAVGRYGGGRNAFALFLESGLYERPLPWRFSFDSYLQGGVVGVRSRDWFVDGALTVSRPVYRQFSAGLGVWGGGQPGLYRVDAGPRLTMRMRKNLKVHVDWRQRLVGNARPGSGPAVTLAGDF